MALPSLLTPGPVSRRQRLVIAAVVAVLAGVLCGLRLHVGAIAAADFTFPWRGAQALLAGDNPYLAVQPTGPYPYNDGLYYPLPGLLVAVPFAPLPAVFAGALFFGLSSGLLAYGLLGQGAYSLLVFAGAPYLYALYTCQWAPLITAAALLPNLAPALLAKPNLGVAIMAGYATRRHIVLCGLVVLLSFLIRPSWPWDWLAELPNHLNYTPLLSWWGPLLLLALWRWRDKQARLLIAMALVPQRLIYDQVALWLIPTTFRQALILTVAGWVGVVVGIIFTNGRLALPAVYLPALAIVLAEPIRHFYSNRLAFAYNRRRHDGK